MGAPSNPPDLALASTAGGLTPVGPDAPAPGERIGRFTVLDLLGSGGMGVVLAAYDLQLDRRVALKLVHPGEGSQDDDQEARLLREARAMARLVHPNILSVYEAGTHENRVYLAMEHVEGRNLREEIEHLRAAGEGSWREIVALFVDAGRGLAAAHAAGLVHRDFKPANVLVGSGGRVLVCDFGLATGSRSGRPGPGVALSGGNIDDLVTRGDVVLGTPAYMPPEQHAGDPVDARADQFAFCASLWEALMGELPFPGREREAYVAAVARGEIREPTTCEVPTWLVRALARGLRADPEERHPGMEALLAELQPAEGVKTVGIAMAGVVIVLGSLLARLGEITHLRLAVAQAAVAVAIVIIGTVFREARRRSPMGQKVFVIILCALTVALLFVAGGEIAGFAPSQTALILPPFWTGIGLALAVTLDRWFWLPCAAYTAAFLVSATWPSAQVPAVAAGHVIMAVSAAIALRPPPSTRSSAGAAPARGRPRSG